MVEQALMQVAWSGGFAKVIRVVDIHTTKYDKLVFSKKKKKKYDKLVGPMKHGYCWGTDTAPVLLYVYPSVSLFFQ